MSKLRNWAPVDICDDLMGSVAFVTVFSRQSW